MDNPVRQGHEFLFAEGSLDEVEQGKHLDRRGHDPQVTAKITTRRDKRPARDRPPAGAFNSSSTSRWV